MAKYTVEYDVKKNEVVRTLEFMSVEYKEVCTHISVEGQITEDVAKEFPLPDSVHDAIDKLKSSSDGERVRLLYEISNYEACVIGKGE